MLIDIVERLGTIYPMRKLHVSISVIQTISLIQYASIGAVVKGVWIIEVALYSRLDMYYVRVILCSICTGKSLEQNLRAVLWLNIKGC